MANRRYYLPGIVLNQNYHHTVDFCICPIGICSLYRVLLCAEADDLAPVYHFLFTYCAFFGGRSRPRFAGVQGWVFLSPVPNPQNVVHFLPIFILHL